MKNYIILLLILLILLFFCMTLNNTVKEKFNDTLIDKIIYINLDHRLDRKKEIENELDRFNLKNYERF